MQTLEMIYGLFPNEMENQIIYDFALKFIEQNRCRDSKKITGMYLHNEKRLFISTLSDYLTHKYCSLIMYNLESKIIRNYDFPDFYRSSKAIKPLPESELEIQGITAITEHEGRDNSKIYEIKVASGYVFWFREEYEGLFYPVNFPYLDKMKEGDRFFYGGM